MRLSFMGVTPMHHNIDSVEPAFEKVLISLELKRIRYDTRGIREHAILGDDGITFDATSTGHHVGSLEPGQLYYYELRIEVQRDGKPVTETKRVILKAGEVARASFPTSPFTNLRDSSQRASRFPFLETAARRAITLTSPTRSKASSPARKRNLASRFSTLANRRRQN